MFNKVDAGTCHPNGDEPVLFGSNKNDILEALDSMVADCNHDSEFYGGCGILITLEADGKYKVVFGHSKATGWLKNTGKGIEEVSNIKKALEVADENIFTFSANF